MKTHAKILGTQPVKTTCIQKYGKTIFQLICLLFIFLFVYTACAKLTDLGNFERMLSRSVLLGSNAHWLSRTVPGLEIVFALLLLAPDFRIKTYGLFGSLLMMIVFTAYLVYMVLFAERLSCRCGGVISAMTWKQHIVFNLFFIVIAGFGLYLSGILQLTNILTFKTKKS